MGGDLPPLLNVCADRAGTVKEFQQPNAYAVVIGISQYRVEVIPKVSYAVKDAQAVAKLLEVQASIPKTHIKLLTDAHVTLGYGRMADMKRAPQRDDIYWVALDPTLGSEIKKTRPAVIISNNSCNTYGARVVVLPITSNVNSLYPGEALITVNGNPARVLGDQILGCPPLHGSGPSSCRQARRKAWEEGKREKTDKRRRSTGGPGFTPQARRSRMPPMDTLHAYETLRSKFDEDTAKTIVGAMAGLVTPSFADLATKTDIHDVKADIEQLRLSTKADIEQLRLATKTDLEQAKTELRTEIQEVKAAMEQLRLATKADIEQLRLATKADIEQLRLATEAQIDRVKTELRTESQDVKADLRTTTAELRADMQGIKAELIRWLFGAALAIVSAMGIMLRLVR